MLQITSINEGIVIDHIRPGYGYKIFKLLKLDEADFKVALIMNVDSNRLGRKDLIKIESQLDIDLDVLGIFDRHLTVNRIADGKIASKDAIHLPKKINAILKCTNPRCITHTERNVDACFSLIDEANKTYACDYCEHLYDVEEI